MCYRYSVPGPDLLVKRFSALFLENVSFTQQYHASSFDLPMLPVITNEHSQQIQLFAWGLIPFWVKEKKTAEEIRLKTMNARAESIFDKPSFRHAAGQQHCLVLADGFFEWQEYQGRNYPYYIRLKSHEPFAMAGLWDVWKNLQISKVFQTYTVITTRANPLMAQIHNKKKRMPVILPKERERDWISKSLTRQDAEAFLVPFDEQLMEAFTISRLITSKQRNPNVPAVSQPFSYPELVARSGQKNLFE
ncbi:MAG: SOS response-associated peptidase [Candidatus Thermoplasmatota archaeon]|nr:SOS response-associated peptidase [Candidatus Thermoplasmatota archaeon]